MKAKYEVGDILATNDLYRQEGRRYFGKQLQYANFKGEALKVIENTHDEKDGQGEVWQNSYIFKGDIQIVERFLTLVSKASDSCAARCIDLNGKRIDIKALVGYISTPNPRGNMIYANDNTDYYAFYVSNEGITLKADRRNKKTGERSFISHVNKPQQEVLKHFIGDVKESGVVLDDMNGIIWGAEANKAEHITAKYFYREEYLPPRCRKPKVRDVEGTVEVTLRNLSSEDAPVALITTTAEAYSGEMVWVDTPYRWYAGSLYVPAISRSGDNAGKAYTLADILHRINVIECGVSTKEEIIRRVQENAACYVFVDGVLYAKSGEPRYHYTTFGMGNNHGGTGFFVDTSYNSNLSLDQYFNAFQRKEALVEFRRVALKRGDTESVKEEPKENIKVLMPEAVRVKPNKLRQAEGGSEEPKVVAVRRILNKQGVLVGLVLSDGRTQVDSLLAECVRLAYKGAIANVKAVRRKKGTTFLQGKGISIETLPYKLC